VTDVVEVRVTAETKTMEPMVCTTRDGVRNVFRDVQVHVMIIIKTMSHKCLYRCLGLHCENFN
jgi:hypothetical protein